MSKEKSLDILVSLDKGEEFNISTEEFQHFMYFRENQKTQVDFKCVVTGNHVKILEKEQDEKDNY